MKIRQA